MVGHDYAEEGNAIANLVITTRYSPHGSRVGHQPRKSSLKSIESRRIVREAGEGCQINRQQYHHWNVVHLITRIVFKPPSLCSILDR